MSVQSWGAADIHVHTTASDGRSTPAAVLLAAHELRLRLIAITDHDTIAGAVVARRLARDYGVEVIVGEEISTREGHLLALWVEQQIAPGRPMCDTIAEVHAQGGLCIVAHPYGTLVSSVGPQLRERYQGDWPVDGVEAFNGSLPLAWDNRRAAELAMATGLPALGGSDSHHAETVGAGLTRFPGVSGADLRTAILARQTVAEGRGWGVGATAAYVGGSLQRGLAGLLRPRAAAGGAR